jgi:tetratricopeptide (TPR) repeat protein
LIGFVLFLLVTSGCASGGPSATPPAAEGMSLLGRPLVAPTLPLAAVARADSALEASPNDANLLLAAAAARATAWKFREAIDLYSRGIAQHPNDARFYRFRGHRYITIRRFEEGARDLDRAAQIDSTNFDIAYHQGLAHYLLGHFAPAAAIYGKCLAFASNDALRAREASGAYGRGYRSCMGTATDIESRVSMSDWYWRALMRAGRVDDAAKAIASFEDGMNVTTNRSYYENILLYKGVRTADQVMTAASSDSVRYSTSGYAVANYLILKGEQARGRELLRRVADSPHWNGFGVIAAEVDLVAKR